MNTFYRDFTLYLLVLFAAVCSVHMLLTVAQLPQPDTGAPTAPIDEPSTDAAPRAKGARKDSLDRIEHEAGAAGRRPFPRGLV
jgi:hypothetical protein